MELGYYVPYMPLSRGKSPKAFQHNVKAEMHAGKPQKQALAIAYSMQRRSPKRMADGGTVRNKKLHPGHGKDPLAMVRAIMNRKKDK